MPVYQRRWSSTVMKNMEAFLGVFLKQLMTNFSNRANSKFTGHFIAGYKTVRLPVPTISANVEDLQRSSSLKYLPYML